MATASNAHADQFEPNEGIHQFAGPLTAGTAYTADTGSANDVDWYVFYTTGQGVVEVAMTNLDDPVGCYPDMSFRDTDGASVSSVEPSPGATERITYTVPGPGRYFVTVDDSCTGDQYRFTVTGPIGSGPKARTAQPTPDANENREQAFGPLTGGQLYAGRADSQNDQDWFFFHTAGPGKLDLALTNVRDGSGCYPALTLTDRDGQSIGSMEPSEDRIDHISLTAPKATTYAIQVDDSCTGDEYLLEVTPAAMVAPELIVDTDGDGVADSTDQCPGEGGAAPTGCAGGVSAACAAARKDVNRYVARVAKARNALKRPLGRSARRTWKRKLKTGRRKLKAARAVEAQACG